MDRAQLWSDGKHSRRHSHKYSKSKSTCGRSTVFLPIAQLASHRGRERGGNNGTGDDDESLTRGTGEVTYRIGMNDQC